jgi:hypothetical protein
MAYRLSASGSLEVLDFQTSILYPCPDCNGEDFMCNFCGGVGYVSALQQDAWNRALDAAYQRLSLSCPEANADPFAGPDAVRAPDPADAYMDCPF